MNIFLCGGGDGAQVTAAYRRLSEVIDRTKPCLYIPLAMEPHLYDGCLDWITAELAPLALPGIDMVRSSEDLTARALDRYSFLFLGGGNTFRLLYELKRTAAFAHIQTYLDESGGTVFGGSAGAIVFGYDLSACRLDDENTVSLTDTKGFDVLCGASLLCHYTNRAPEKIARSRAYLSILSKAEHRRIYALPEELTLFVHDGETEVLGDGVYSVFEEGEERRQ